MGRGVVAGQQAPPTQAIQQLQPEGPKTFGDLPADHNNAPSCFYSHKQKPAQSMPRGSLTQANTIPITLLLAAT
jgi:hypothetical protein